MRGKKFVFLSYTKFDVWIGLSWLLTQVGRTALILYINVIPKDTIHLLAMLSN